MVKNIFLRYATLIGTLLLTGIFFVGFLAVDWFSSKEAPPTAKEVKSTQYWASLIQKRGAKDAYQHIADVASSYSKNRQHSIAHAFGGALYEALGADGIYICDQEYEYGCFHELIGRAITLEGIEAATDLNESCIRLLGDADAGFCQHGVGHGIQGYSGYSQRDLLGALEICGALRDNDPIGGCAGGIFMEYNQRTMLGEDGEIRISSGDILEPCTALTNTKDIRACAYWQPEWWKSLLDDQVGRDNESMFKQMGEWCTRFEDPYNLASECFEGIGNTIPSVDGITKQKAMQYCRAAAPENDTYYAWCIRTTEGRI